MTTPSFRRLRKTCHMPLGQRNPGTCATSAHAMSLLQIRGDAASLGYETSGNCGPTLGKNLSHAAQPTQPRPLQCHSCRSEVTRPPRKSLIPSQVMRLGAHKRHYWQANRHIEAPIGRHDGSCNLLMQIQAAVSSLGCISLTEAPRNSGGLIKSAQRKFSRHAVPASVTMLNSTYAVASLQF